MPQLHVQHALLETGWQRDVLISIEGRRIAAIEAGASAPAGAERLAGIAVPGVANVHSHAFQRAMAGLVERRGPEDDSFWTWREVMYRFLARMSPDDVEAIAAWAYVEMLEAGFTAVGEFHYLHNAPDGTRYADPAEMAGRIVAAAEASGIGLALLPCFYAHGGCGGKAAKPGQARFLSDIESFRRLIEASRRHLSRLDGAVLGIAPHSLRAVDAAELRALVDAWPAGPIHMHAAEQMGEVEECIAWSGARPVAMAARQHGRGRPLVPDPHDAHDAAREPRPGTLRRHGRSLPHHGGQPRRRHLRGRAVSRCGRAHRGRHRQQRAHFGCRGAAHAGVRPAPAREKRNRLGPTGASTGRHLFDLARAGGARALGLDGGMLAVGKVADIVVLDAEHPALIGRDGDAALDAWVFASGDGVVRDVFAGGRHVVVDGRHVARDAILARFAAAMRRLPT